MGKHFIKIFVFICALFISVNITSQAHAAPNNNVKATMKILNGAEYCTLGAVGTDNENNKIGLTAGHCGQVGEYLTNINNEPIGKIVNTDKQFDIAVILLNKNVNMVKSELFNDIGSPIINIEACKTGHGQSNVGTKCGKIIGLNNTDVCTTIWQTPGDSGGPVVANNKLIGLVSRLYGSPCGVEVSARLDTFLDKLEKDNKIGSGFSVL